MELLIAFVAAGFISFYAVSVGGGGLVLIPILILLGLEVKMAVATAQFGFLFLALVGLHGFSKGGKVDYKIARRATVSLAIGTVIGALILISLDTEIVRNVVGFFLILVLGISFLHEDFGLRHRAVGMVKRAFGHISLVFLGIYKGIVGGGSGIFANYIYIYLFGLTFLESSGTRKLPFVVSHLITTFIFAQNGLIDWPIGIALAFGNTIGAYWGTKHALKKGELWVKYFFAVIVIASAIKLML